MLPKATREFEDRNEESSSDEMIRLSKISLTLFKDQQQRLTANSEKNHLLTFQSGNRMFGSQMKNHNYCPTCISFDETKIPKILL